MTNRRGTSPAARFAAFQLPKCSITVCGWTGSPGPPRTPASSAIARAARRSHAAPRGSRRRCTDAAARPGTRPAPPCRSRPRCSVGAGVHANSVEQYARKRKWRECRVRTGLSLGSPGDERPPHRRADGRARRCRPLPRRRPRRRNDAAGEAALEARPRRDRPLRRTAAAGRRRSSRPRTARRRRARWRPRSSGLATGSRRTTRARTSSRASPPPCWHARDAELGLLEVDEGALPEVARAGAAARRLSRQPLP